MSLKWRLQQAKNFIDTSRFLMDSSSNEFKPKIESVRKKDKRDSSTLNPRLETRTNCKARLGVTLVDNKYKVNEFTEVHNHPLHIQETVHMLSSQRKVTEVQSYEIDLAEDVGLKQKSTFQLMSRHAWEIDGLGYTMLDAKNYIRSKRQKSMVYGEVGCLMRYFQQQLSKNPSFYHANQMDVEEQVTNVFWADARMLIDYEYFGDVVSLDTTYCMNRAHRPLAIFSGFNHHRGAVIFGAALLYDETSSSFEWLFETFLEVHKQKKPLTIFTDQDQAMAKALHECCMYGIDNEIKFEEAWSVLLSQYNVHENTWLQSTYNIKEKWAACYMKKAFTLAAYIKYKNETQPLFEYVVGLIDKEGEWRVTLNPSTKMISCSCRKFEITGLLCCHAVKVYDVLDVKKISEDYILNRWTRKTRSEVVHDYMGNEVEEDPKRQSTERYRKLCMMLVRLATEASAHPSTFSLVHNSVCDLTKQVMEMRLTGVSQDNNDGVRTSRTGPSIIQAKGFKKRIGDTGTHDELSASCSTPPVPQACLQTTGSQFNFTELLMTQFNHPQHSLEAMDYNGDIFNTHP
ncbi:protein FAR1-RELATED SEQUENCE 5-like [Henckelia pumila]|uniref:protein FAR1-RELATED SEQUENCE 5-like n=1 Tax=Henckelia pumila TaxID=405737 RepID=UPI003C6DCDE5